MQPAVWFTDLRSRPGRSLPDKTGELLRAVGLAGKVRVGARTAVKLHFGERGDASLETI